MAEFVDGGAGGFLVDDRVAHPAVPWVNDRSSPAGMPTAPLLPDDLEQLLRRLRMPRTRAAAPEMIATATSQRWEPAECCAPCSPPSSPGGTGPRWRPGGPGRDLRGRIEHLRARTRPNPTPTSAPDSENTLILALTAQINELKKRLRQDVQALRNAVEKAHGENLDLRRELTRRGTSTGAGPHPNYVASIATTT